MSEKVQCLHVYPLNSRERGAQCARMVRAKSKTQLCNQHVSCGRSQREGTAHIRLEKDWSVWR